MKVFVGTMECGEAEFNACVDAINQQIGVEFKHYIVSNLPEREAHAALFDAWNAAKNEFDLLLKVDADTVLAHNCVMQEHVKLFEANPRLTGTQAWLHDYMTNDKLYGLSCIRNNVKFEPIKNGLYPDRVDTGHDIQIRGDALPLSLNPAGFHAMSPTYKQAFHYGLHRALKNQVENLRKVKIAHSKFNDIRRAYALAGAEAAHKFIAKNVHNYQNYEFEEAFKAAQLKLGE